VSRTIVILDGYQTGQELLEEAMRVLASHLRSHSGSGL
jgi:hypothetical protein